MSFNGTIPEVLMMFNGELIRAATGGGRDTLVDSVAISNQPFKDKVNYLFQAGLGRNSDSQDTRLANQFLEARNGNLPAALRDMWWVILNTNEFILNH